MLFRTVLGFQVLGCAGFGNNIANAPENRPLGYKTMGACKAAWIVCTWTCGRIFGAPDL